MKAKFRAKSPSLKGAKIWQPKVVGGDEEKEPINFQDAGFRERIVSAEACMSTRFPVK